MNTNQARSSINKLIKKNNMEQELFIVDKRILDTFYEVLDRAQSYINRVNREKYDAYGDNLYHILRSSRELTSHVYLDKEHYIESSLQYIDDTFRKMHPSYKIELEELIDKLSLAYLDYICKINNLLNWIDAVVIKELLDLISIRVRDCGIREKDKFNLKIEHKECETLKVIAFDINANGYINVSLEDGKRIFSFSIKDNPMKEFGKNNITDLFLTDMRETNFQKIVNTITDKRYLFEQAIYVDQETTHIRILLQNYIKYGFEIVEIDDSNKKHEIVDKYFKDI